MATKKKKQHMCLEKGCLKTFSRPYRLEQHMRVHTGEKPFKCDFPDCEHSYARAAHLKRHKETAHSRDTPTQSFTCGEDGCNKSFKYAQNLKRHVSVEHEKKNVYRCSEKDCDQFFRKRHQLKAHTFEHKGVLPFQCHFEGCEKKFTQRSHLDRHFKVHDGYTCDETDCELVFTTWSLYRKHKVTDHKTGPKCPVCGKTFAKKSWLTQHEKTHTPQRPLLVCPREGCDRAYAEVRNLNHHIRFYHENTGFTCNICKRVLVTKQKLQVHMNTHSPSYVGKQYPRRKGVPRKGKKMTDKLTVALTGVDLRKENNGEPVEILDSSDTEVPFVNKITVEPIYFSDVDEAASKTMTPSTAPNVTHYDKKTVDMKTGLDKNQNRYSATEIDLQVSVSERINRKRTDVCVIDSNESCANLAEVAQKGDVCRSRSSHSVTENVISKEEFASSGTLKTTDNKSDFEMSYKKKTCDENLIYSGSDANSSFEEVGVVTNNESGNSADINVEVERLDKIAQPDESNEKPVKSVGKTTNNTNSTSANEIVLDTGQFAVTMQPIVTETNDVLNNTTDDKLKWVSSSSVVSSTNETFLDKNQVVVSDIETISENNTLSTIGIEIVGNEVITANMAREVDKRVTSESTNVSTEENQEQTIADGQKMIIYLTENAPCDSEADTEYVINVEIPEELLPKYRSQDDLHQYNGTTCASVSSDCARQNMETEGEFSERKMEPVGFAQSDVNVEQEDDIVANKDGDDGATKTCDKNDKRKGEDITGLVTVHVANEHQNKDEILKHEDVDSSGSNVSEIDNIYEGKSKGETSDRKPGNEKQINYNGIELSLLSNKHTIQQNMKSTRRTDIQENNFPAEVKNTESVCTLEYLDSRPKQLNMDIERKNGDISVKETRKGNEPLNSQRASKYKGIRGHLSLIRNTTRRAAHLNMACARKTQHPLSNSGNPNLRSNEPHAKLSKRISESIPNQNGKKLCVGPTVGGSVGSTCSEGISGVTAGASVLRDGGDVRGSMRDKLSSIIFNAL